MNIISCFLQMLLLLFVPPCVLGAGVWLCRRLFCFFVGDDSGLPLIKLTSFLSVPLREAGHAMMAVIFLHRIEDMRLLDLRAADGEFGFVEHSYNPRNPIALLGNFFYALGPAVIGLFAVLVILLGCFGGILPPFLDSVRKLGEVGAGFWEYAKAAFSLFADLFTAGDAGAWMRVLGCALLALICFGIHVDPVELLDAIMGIVILGGMLLLTAGVLILFDDRVVMGAMNGLRSFSTAVSALFLVVLTFAAALTVLGFLFGVIRTLFNIDHIEVPDEEA